MKTFTKPNCNICMEEHLTVLKKIGVKHFTVMNKNLLIYGASYWIMYTKLVKNV